MHSLFNKNNLVVYALFLMICSCKKEETTIVTTPELEFLSVTPSDLKEYQQPLVFIIHYKDGDGDLGENNASVKNLFLIDNRIGLKYEYRLQQLAPDNSPISISGNFKVELNTVAITDGSSIQNGTFSIYVIDRAGNKSNVVTSSTIVIRK